jgi:hypothetical protein
MAPRRDNGRFATSISDAELLESVSGILRTADPVAPLAVSQRAFDAARERRRLPADLHRTQDL